jgi:sulfite reductase (NADPH) hemoprotein beta-component
MPRKFKISFSACESDCAQGMMHDMGIIAVQNGTNFGFKVLAGGGLGHKPHEAIVVEEFIEEKDLLLVMEAIISLHNRYSDRVKRAKARIKFLVDKFGREGFIEKYHEELERTRAALAKQEYPKGEWNAGTDGKIPGIGAPRRLFEQKQSGFYVFPISVPMGNLNAIHLRGLAEILETFELNEIRTTQDQNMILTNIEKAKIDALRSAVSALGLGEPQTGDNVVACPGTSTCRLGITSSTVLGPKLSGGEHDLKIRVSGCHNGCAQPETGDILEEMVWQMGHWQLKARRFLLHVLKRR